MDPSTKALEIPKINHACRFVSGEIAGLIVKIKKNSMSSKRKTVVGIPSEKVFNLKTHINATRGSSVEINLGINIFQENALNGD